MSKEDEESMRQEISFHDGVMHVDIWYPRSCSVQAVQVGLMDVRAADDIRVSYDFERDGWVISQASTFSWADDDTEQNEDWQEVAFIEAWARQVER